MYNIHTTRDGEQMLIAQMEDKHLINTIRMILRKVQSATAALSNPVTINPMIGVFHPEMKTDEIRRKAENVIRQGVDSLQPYLMEAYMRPGMAIALQEDMQSAFGRVGRMPSIDLFGNFALPESDEDEDF